MLKIETVPPAKTQQIADLAAEIWREHYPPIIGMAQVDYMLDKYQSSAAIRTQIEQGIHYYLLRSGEDLVGYFAIELTPPDRLFISKLYLSATFRGRGLAREALAFIENYAKSQGAKRLWLTVNKQNPALQAYLRLGFTVIRSIVTDIGGGYVMDDYHLEKPVQLIIQ